MIKVNPGVKDQGIEPGTFQFMASCHSNELQRPLQRRPGQLFYLGEI